MKRCGALSSSGKRCTRYEGHQGVHWNWRDGGSALWLLAAVMLGGCTGDVWRVDSRFTAEERADIDRAAEMWGAVGHPVYVAHGYHVNGLEETGRHIVRVHNRDAVAVAPTMANGAAAKYIYEPLRERIVINVENMGQVTPFWQIVAHEMGHSLGLGHVNDARAIMFFEGNRVSLRCVTKADIEEMCRTAGCVDGLKGCDE